MMRRIAISVLFFIAILVFFRVISYCDFTDVSVTTDTTHTPKYVEDSYGADISIYYGQGSYGGGGVDATNPDTTWTEQ